MITLNRYARSKLHALGLALAASLLLSCAAQDVIEEHTTVPEQAAEATITIVSTETALPTVSVPAPSATPSPSPDEPEPSPSSTDQVMDPYPAPDPTERLPSDVPGVTPLPVKAAMRLAEPLVIDGQAGWIYASGQLDGRWKTVKLSTKDGSLLEAYDHTGKLALDQARGRLFVDQGEAGIAVLDAGTGDLLSVVTLPVVGPAKAQPQADPSSGLLYAFRGNSVYVLDPVSLDVARTATMIVPTSVCGDAGEDAAINASFYDDTSHRLYLAFVTYVCTPWVQQTLVAYDADTLAELGRHKTERTFQALPCSGRLHGTTTSQLGRSVSWAWDGDEAWHELADDGRRLGGIVVDRQRRLIYEALDEQIWVLNPRSREVISRTDETLLSRGARLAAYDSVSDRLYFLLDGRLETRPASAILAD